MTDIQIEGEPFRVEVEGDLGRPVLLLSSSLGSDLSMWDAQMPALLAHFRVVRYDPRGHGRSTCAGAPYSLARLGADALAILDALGVERAHVLGISMGGAVAQWLLVHAPERIDRAVLANTGARFGTPDVWNERIRTVLSHGPQALAAGTMERWFSSGFRARGAEHVAPIERVFRATSSAGYAGCCAALRDMDMREALRTIDRPVLVVTGRDDPVTSATGIAAMLDAIAGAQHVSLDCKHLSNIEAQAEFDAAVIDFLTAQTPVRAGKARTAKPRASGKRQPLLAGRASARSPLKPAAARPVAAPSRRRPADPARIPAKPARTKASPRKAATRAASARRVSPATARAPIAKPAATKSATRKTKTRVETPSAAATKPRRSAAVAKPKTLAEKGAATKPTPRTAAARKTSARKAVPVATAKPKTVVAKTAATKQKTAKKPTARRPAGKRPGRPTGRGRR